MIIDVFEYIHANDEDLLCDMREFGKDPFYTIVETGESYESFKKAFISSDKANTSEEPELGVPLSEEAYTFQTIKEFLKNR